MNLGQSNARAVPQYILLFVIAMPAIWIQAGNTRNLFTLLAKAPQMPAMPFSINAGTREIGSGPYRGNQILGIEGKPFTSPRQFAQKLDVMLPGQPLTVLMSEPGGHAVERKVMLTAMVKEKVGLPTATLWITLDFLIPTAAFLLGAFTVLVRPRDLNAWLLLLMLLAFGEVSRAHYWTGPQPEFTFFWSAVAVAAWPVSMMLFGIYFPERLPADRRHPWIKYLILVPSILCPLFYWSILNLWQRDVNRAEPWRVLFVRLGTAQIIISMLAISTFFANIGAKSGIATADAKRRLKILWVGTAIALTPLFLVVLYGLVRQRDFFDGVPFLLAAPVLMCLLLFPVTLAYVIVIERAMDLTFVIRQSVRYGVLRGGLWVLRAVLFGMGVYLLGNAGMYSNATRQAELLGVGAALLLLRKQGADLASRWVDKRFFREAYDAEKVLSDLASEAGRFITLAPLLETVAKRIQDTLHVRDVAVLLRNGERFETVYFTRACQPVGVDAQGALIGNVNRPLVIDFERPAAWLGMLSGEEIQAIDLLRSQLLLPLPGNQHLAGFLSLGPKMSQVPYSPSDLRLLQAVTTQVGLSIENSRLAESLAQEAAQRERLNREVEIARDVQQRLFPQSYPAIEGMEYCGYCRPALQVGGDYYDFLQLHNGAFGIAIGDVSGKGIAAALLMASLQASLRGQTIANQHDLSALMRNINKLVFDASGTNRYATFFYGEFDPRTRRLTYINAGHNAPMVLQRDGGVLRLDQGGPVVGLLPTAEYEQAEIQLRRDDIVVAFTDGISEAMNPDDEEWEEERLLVAAQGLTHLDSAAMIEQLFVAADAFVNGAPQHDDMTLIVAKLA